VSQQAERLLRDLRLWLRSETTTFGGGASDFGAATGGEGEADDAGGELGIAGAVWAAADGCGFCGAGCATTPVTAWADFIFWTRLHAAKDTATATSVTTATLLPCSFMANVYRGYVRRLRNERMRTSERFAR